jgi:hypothetical protein
MKRWGIPAAAMLVSGVLAISALAGTIVSGLEAGGHMSQFNVVDVSGPAKGQTLCYV